jgi:transposase
MFTVELYARIRRAVMVDGLSRREAARRFGIHRNTITKMLQFSVSRPATGAANGRLRRSWARKGAKYYSGRNVGQ